MKNGLYIIAHTTRGGRVAWAGYSREMADRLVILYGPGFEVLPSRRLTKKVLSFIQETQPCTAPL